MRLDVGDRGRTGIFLVTLLGSVCTFEMPPMSRGKVTSDHYQGPPEMIVLVQVTTEHSYFDLCTGEIYEMRDFCYEPTGKRVTQEMLTSWFNEECKKRIEDAGTYAVSLGKGYRSRGM